MSETTKIIDEFQKYLNQLSKTRIIQIKTEKKILEQISKMRKCQCDTDKKL